MKTSLQTIGLFLSAIFIFSSFKNTASGSVSGNTPATLKGSFDKPVV